MASQVRWPLQHTVGQSPRIAERNTSSLGASTGKTPCLNQVRRPFARPQALVQAWVRHHWPAPSRRRLWSSLLAAGWRGGLVHEARMEGITHEVGAVG